jgi:fluoride exporter
MPAAGNPPHERRARLVTWLAVGVGGALGSLARHAVNQFVHARWGTLPFPLATTMVNVAGCFAIGLLAGLVASGGLELRAQWREFVFVGLLGGFTTFSTFGLETLTLAQGQGAGPALAGVAAQVAGGLLAVYVGYRLGI